MEKTKKIKKKGRFLVLLPLFLPVMMDSIPFTGLFIFFFHMGFHPTLLQECGAKQALTEYSEIMTQKEFFLEKNFCQQTWSRCEELI